MKAASLGFVIAHLLVGCLLTGCRSAQHGQVPETVFAEWSGGGGCHVRGKFYSLNLTSERVRKTPHGTSASARTHRYCRAKHSRWRGGSCPRGLRMPIAGAYGESNWNNPSRYRAKEVTFGI